MSGRWGRSPAEPAGPADRPLWDSTVGLRVPVAAGPSEGWRAKEEPPGLHLLSDFAPQGSPPATGRGPSRAAEQDEHSRLCWDPVRPPGPCDHGAGPAAHPGWCPGLGAGSLAPLCGDPEVGGRLAVGVGAPSLCCCPPVSHWRELFQSSGSFGASSWGPSATSSPAGPPGGRPSSHTLLRTPLSSLQSWLLPPPAPGAPQTTSMTDCLFE